ncbi:MAG: LysE family transporter [Candidatus Helarchaeota archaeon]
MILIQIFFLSFIYGLSGALTPGPVLTGVIVDTPKSGWKTGPFYIIGHSMLESLVVLASFFGLSLILNLPPVFITVSIGGSIVLFILAFLLIKDIKNVSITEIINKANEKKSRNTIFAGIYLSISNPFWIIWWATAGLAHMNSLNIFYFGAIGAVIYFLGHISGDFSWYTFISSMLFLGKNFITDRIYKIILICCASFFIYFGIKFILLVFFPFLWFPI